MRREGQPYYVGLLKAAELHGATHQAVMEFQVISNKRLPRIRAGRNLIVFYFRKEMEAVTAGIAGQIFVLLRVASERSMARDGCSS